MYSYTTKDNLHYPCTKRLDDNLIDVYIVKLDDSRNLKIVKFSVFYNLYFFRFA